MGRRSAVGDLRTRRPALLVSLNTRARSQEVGLNGKVHDLTAIYAVIYRCAFRCFYFFLPCLLTADLSPLLVLVSCSLLLTNERYLSGQSTVICFLRRCLLLVSFIWVVVA